MDSASLCSLVSTALFLLGSYPQQIVLKFRHCSLSVLVPPRRRINRDVIIENLNTNQQKGSWFGREVYPPPPSFYNWLMNNDDISLFDFFLRLYSNKNMVYGTGVDYKSLCLIVNFVVSYPPLLQRKGVEGGRSLLLVEHICICPIISN